MAVILVLGDTHIPRRASGIPESIERFLSSMSFDLVMCTGDLTGESVLQWLRKFGEVLCVRGNMDHLPLPEYAEAEVEGVRIGLIHGDQVYPRGDREQLNEIAEEKGVDVLVSGHTHSPDACKLSAILLNPGSATGVWGGGGGSLKPSFMILKVFRGKLVAELYELERGLKRSVFEFDV